MVIKLQYLTAQLASMLQSIILDTYLEIHSVRNTAQIHGYPYKPNIQLFQLFEQDVKESAEFFSRVEEKAQWPYWVKAREVLKT